MAVLERAAIVYACNNFNFDDYWILRSAFDLIWVFNGGVLGDYRYNLFISYYRFTEGTVEVIPEEPVEVYFLRPDFALGMLAWMIEFGFECPAPGSITAFPEVGFSPCDLT